MNKKLLMRRKINTWGYSDKEMMRIAKRRFNACVSNSTLYKFLEPHSWRVDINIELACIAQQLWAEEEGLA